MDSQHDQVQAIVTRARDRKQRAAFDGFHCKLPFIDLGTGGHRGHMPPRFGSKQRNALVIFRKCPLFLREKEPSKCRAPKFEMLPTSLGDTPLVES